MKWHRGQQIYLALLAIVPGLLVHYQVIRPPYAALMLVFLYFCSKRHAFMVQRQFDQEQHDKKVSDADEKNRLAAMPLRKRRAVERAKRRNQAADDSALTTEFKDE